MIKILEIPQRACRGSYDYSAYQEEINKTLKANNITDDMIINIEHERSTSQGLNAFLYKLAAVVFYRAESNEFDNV